MAAVAIVFSPPISGDSAMPAVRPDIQGVFPHGARRGTETTVTIRGRYLQNTTEIRFANARIEATLLAVEHNRVRARFRLAAVVEPGRKDFRLIAPHGSTTAWFDVSDRPEVVEKEPNDNRASAEKIPFPALINGIIRGGDYDYFQFRARAGQTMVFDLLGRRNGSSLDGVLSLLDEQGDEIDYSDDYYMFKDPHLVHTFDREGIYFLRIYGSGESGSDNADYRLLAGELPHVDHAMPSGARRGQTVEFDLAGVNLDSVDRVVLGEGLAEGRVIRRGSTSARARLEIPEGIPTGPHRLHAGGATLPVPFVISDHPEVTATGESARRKQDPLPVTLPVIANGVLSAPRAADHFTFRVDAPTTVTLAVDSMQLGFLLDPMVAIYDESGKRMAWQDEPTTNTGKEPANLDPHLVFRLPKAGRYTAMVRDSQYRGDPTFAYRFTMKPAEPDFTLTVIGSDETLYRGRDNVVTVRVRRREGWNTPVEVWAEDLPAGVSAPRRVAEPVNTPYKGTCGEVHYLDGTNVEIPLTVSGNVPPKLSQIRFVGRGVVVGKPVVREAHTRHWFKGRALRGLTETRFLHATIADAPELVFTTPERFAVAAGKSGRLKIVIARLDGGGHPLVVEADSPAPGLVVEPAVVPPGATLAEVRITSSTDKPVPLILVGKTSGRILGKSFPILIEKPAKGSAEAPVDEN